MNIPEELIPLVEWWEKDGKQIVMCLAAAAVIGGGLGVAIAYPQAKALHEAGFTVKYNTDMELLTIRGYTHAQLQQYVEAEGVYMTQRSRKVLRILRRK